MYPSLLCDSIDLQQFNSYIVIIYFSLKWNINILKHLLLATLGVNWKWTSSSLSELRTWYPVSGILMSKNNNNQV